MSDIASDLLEIINNTNRKKNKNNTNYEEILFKDNLNLNNNKQKRTYYKKKTLDMNKYSKFTNSSNIETERTLSTKNNSNFQPSENLIKKFSNYQYSSRNPLTNNIINQELFCVHSNSLEFLHPNNNTKYKKNSKFSNNNNNINNNNYIDNINIYNTPINVKKNVKNNIISNNDNNNDNNYFNDDDNTEDNLLNDEIKLININNNYNENDDKNLIIEEMIPHYNNFTESINISQTKDEYKSVENTMGLTYSISNYDSLYVNKNDDKSLSINNSNNIILLNDTNSNIKNKIYNNNIKNKIKNNNNNNKEIKNNNNYILEDIDTPNYKNLTNKIIENQYIKNYYPNIISNTHNSNICIIC